MATLREDLFAKLDADYEYVFAFQQFREHHAILLDGQGQVGRSVAYQMFSWGWLDRAIFEDQTLVYKVKPDVMLEFEQYERERMEG